MFICYFAIISLGKGWVPFSPKYALCQVWLKSAQWFCRRRFLNFVKVFSLFCNYLPLEKSRVLYLNKIEFPSNKDALCQVYLKFAQWFWIRGFLNFINVFSLFRNYFPLEKCQALHFPFTRGCFVPSLVEISPVVLEKKIKMWKVYDNANDNEGQQTNFDHLNLWLRWAKQIKSLQDKQKTKDRQSG